MAITGSERPSDWSSDGRYIAYTELNDASETNSGRHSVGILQLSPKKEASLFLHTGSDEFGARFSPDGKWLAYVGNETGRFEVYVVSFPNLTQKWKVSTDGGTQPVWRRDGKELFFITPDDKMTSVSVAHTPTGLDFGKPASLFVAHVHAANAFFQEYDVTPNGQKFVINSRVDSTPVPLTIVTNWTGLLKK